MRKSFVSFTLCAMLFALCDAVEAQQATKTFRIGYLSAGGRPESNPRTAFVQGLRDLGYIEDKNLVIDIRHAQGKLDRLPDLAADLVRLKVDLIFAPSSLAARIAKQATSAIPIIFLRSCDGTC